MKKAFLIIASAALLFAVGCEKNPENGGENNDPAEEKGYVKVSPTSIDATAEAGTYTVSVEANVYWDVEVPASVDWISVSPVNGQNDGVVSVNILVNGPEARETAITFSSQNKDVEDIVVTIKQAAGQYVPEEKTALYDFTVDYAKLLETQTWPIKSTADTKTNDYALGLGTAYVPEANGKGKLQWFYADYNNYHSSKEDWNTSVQTGRFMTDKNYLVAGAESKDDGWYFTLNEAVVPVDAEVTVEATVFSSSTATMKYWAVEYSVDGGENWDFLGETKTTSITGDKYTYEITMNKAYDLIHSGKLAKASTGTLMVRLRCASSQNKADDGEVTGTTNGNTQIRVYSKVTLKWLE